MPKINIDELVEPIKVTVGGKEYIVEDIPQDTAKKMMDIGRKAEEGADDSTEQLASIMAEVLGADKTDIAKLGMRKLTMLVKKVMDTINEELEGKNVSKAAVTK